MIHYCIMSNPIARYFNSKELAEKGEGETAPLARSGNWYQTM